MCCCLFVLCLFIGGRGFLLFWFLLFFFVLGGYVRFWECVGCKGVLCALFGVCRLGGGGGGGGGHLHMYNAFMWVSLSNTVSIDMH